MTALFLRFLPYLIAAFVGAAIVHNFDAKHYDKLLVASSQYQGAVLANGANYKQRVADQVARDKANTEKANEDFKRSLVASAGANHRLRGELDSARAARGGFTPPAPAGSVCPSDQICFDRAAFGEARRGLVEDLRRAADEGTTLEKALEIAREWARGL